MMNSKLRLFDCHPEQREGSLLQEQQSVIPTKVGIQRSRFRSMDTRFREYDEEGANNVGSVKYEYCLSCDSALSPSPPALSHRREREPLDAAAGSGIRSRSPNLNLLRADELYDNDSNGLEDNDGWRRIEVNTHRPGSLGALVGKRAKPPQGGSVAVAAASAAGYQCTRIKVSLLGLPNAFLQFLHATA